MSSSICPINPSSMAPPAGHYSHAMIAGGLVFVSGQLPITSSGERLNQASFDEQATQALANVQAVLEAAGSHVSQLVQVRVYITSIGNWPAFNRLYAQWAGQSLPARAVVPVPELHYGFAIEVEAVGALGAPADSKTD
jgi:2-iminobutanoate/2-iminopropanoate deaminase